MKFIIDRASNWGEKPCEEATPETIVWINKFGKKIKGDVFVVEISTLEELLNFIEKYGNIVMEKETSFGFKRLPEIIIYDDYIE